jgi:hypothetical protein
MPEQSFNIGYGFDDFFYDKGNVQLKTTLPFDKGNLAAWVNSKDSNANVTTADNFFDVRITKVVFNSAYKDDFINNYLPGNILIKGLNNFSNNTFSNFDARTSNVTIVTNSDGSYDRKYALEKGNITLSINGTSDIIYDFSLNKIDQSSITYKKDGSIDVDSIFLNGSSDMIEEEITEPGLSAGVKTYITNHTTNPRCKYTKKDNQCTKDHWHYQSCTTQTFYNPDGTSYCRCVCKGPSVKNATPHDHCSPYVVNQTNNSNDNYINNYDKSTDRVKLTNSISQLISDIKVSVKPERNDSVATGVKTNFDFDYNNINDLTTNDLEIRKLLYNYYYELNRNIELRDLIIQNDSIDSTSKQALLDANVKYKKEYLQLFNIFSGIFFVSGYIYIMNKT